MRKSYMASETSKSTLRLRPSEHRVILIIGDLLMGMLSVVGGVYGWAIGIKGLQFSLDFFQSRVPFWFYLLPLAWMLLLTDLYDVHRAANWRRTTRGVLVAALVCAMAYLLIYFASREPENINRRGVAGFLILVIAGYFVWDIFNRM